MLEWGIDVKYALAAVGVGVLTLNVGMLLLNGMFALGLAVVVGGGIYGVTKWATMREPQMAAILLLAWYDMRGWRLPKRYDPLRYEGKL